MDFPRVKKTLRGLLISIERLAGYSKHIALSAGIVTFASGQPVEQPKVPVDPKLSIQKSEITKYSSKYLLRSAAASLSKAFVQHRSHSSHSSHASHASHYSSSSSPRVTVPSHSSHYSASVTPPPVRTSPSTPSVRVPPVEETTSSTVVLSDYFNDQVRAALKWKLGALTAGSAFTDPQVTVVERNARLEIAPRSNASARSYNGYVSASSWNFTGAHARVDVFQTCEGTANTIFAVGTDSNNWYGFVVESGKLYLQSKIDGRKNSQSITYDATEHQSWRIRHEASENQILWETSPDGTTWTIQRQIAPQIPLTALYVTLSAGTYMTEAEPGLAVFDNFKLVVHK